MRLLRCALAAAFLAVPVAALADPPDGEPPASSHLGQRTPLEILREPGPLPALSWDQPTSCSAIGGKRVRYQCDAASRRCLVAADVELDANGAPTAAELSRVQFCNAEPPEVRAVEGYRFVQAVPEAPPGWVRDERGRVMQFNFDMHRRVWIGGGVVPQVSARGGAPVTSGEAEFGTRIDWADDDGQTLRRLHLLEGHLDPGFARYDLTALEYDTSHVFTDAAIRITTFVGEPRRHDIHLDVGLFVEAGRFETFARDRNQTWVTVAELEPTLDLWRSTDLESYLRVRLGPALEHDSLTNSYVFTGDGGLDFEGILDRDGFHRLYASGDIARIWGLPGRADRARVATRFEGHAGYELILLAVNDQPISLVLEGRAAWRDDVASIAPGWEWSGLGGLRFSFWAPARRGATVVHEAR